MMSSRAPSFPSRTWGFTCLFFSSAIRSIWGILGIADPWNKIILFKRKILFHEFKEVLPSLNFCICELSIIAVMIPYVLQPGLETMMAELPLDSGSPFSSSAQALAVLSVSNKSTCCNEHINNNESTPNPLTHLIGLYEASKYCEKHGRLCSFGILPEILHCRTVSLLNREWHESMKHEDWPQFWLDGCRLTCAVLLSLAKVSRSAQLDLMKSFNIELSSWTRNSFLAISIPRSSERMSWRRPSNDTFKETELSLYHFKHRDTAGAGESDFVPKAALSTKCSSVWKFSRSGYLSCMMVVMKWRSVWERSVDLVSSSYIVEGTLSKFDVKALLNPDNWPRGRKGETLIFVQFS